RRAASTESVGGIGPDGLRPDLAGGRGRLPAMSNYGDGFGHKDKSVTAFGEDGPSVTPSRPTVRIVLVAVCAAVLVAVICAAIVPVSYYAITPGTGQSVAPLIVV